MGWEDSRDTGLSPFEESEFLEDTEPDLRLWMGIYRPVEELSLELE